MNRCKIAVLRVMVAIAEFIAIFANANSAADVCKRVYLVNVSQFAICA